MANEKKLGRPKTDNIHYKIGGITLSPEDSLQWDTLRDTLSEITGDRVSASVVVRFMIRHGQWQKKMFALQADAGDE